MQENGIDGRPRWQRLIPMMKDVKIEPIDENMNAKPSVMETFPDSGCQETLVHADLMDYLRLELDKWRKKPIIGIDGKIYVPCLGSTKFQLTHDRQQTNVLTFFTSGLSNKVVLSWRRLQRLSVQCLQLLFEQSPLNRPNFIMLFYYIKVPPHFSPPGPTLALTGALKWGTVWTSTSNGTGIMKGQSSSKCKINFDLS